MLQLIKNQTTLKSTVLRLADEIKSNISCMAFKAIDRAIIR